MIKVSGISLSLSPSEVRERIARRLLLTESPGFELVKRPSPSRAGWTRRIRAGLPPAMDRGVVAFPQQPFPRSPCSWQESSARTLPAPALEARHRPRHDDLPVPMDLPIPFDANGLETVSMALQNRMMTLVAFLQAQNCSNLPGSWRHPATMLDFLTPEYYQRIAGMLEARRGPSTTRTD